MSFDAWNYIKSHKHAGDGAISTP